jgi:hypothetical protein
LGGKGIVMTIEQITTLVGALLLSLPGIGALILQFKKNKAGVKKDESETAKLIAEAAGEVVKNLVDECKRLESRIIGIEKENEKLQLEILTLQDCKLRLEDCVNRVEKLNAIVKELQKIIKESE